MSNVSYVSDLANNLKTQKYGVSKFNSLNVSKDSFISDRSKMSDLHEFKCTNNRSVFGGNITIPKSNNWTSQLNSNLKSSLAMGAFSLGAVGLSEANSVVSMNSTAGISRGYCAIPVAVIAVLSSLGIACNATYDLFSKIVNNPFTDDEKNEILMDDNGVIMDYDAVFGRVSLPQSSICGITKYLLRIGVLDSTGIDSRANYYGATRYNIIGNSYRGKNGINYLTRKGYSLGVVSGEIEIHYRYHGDYTGTLTYTPNCSGELFLDVYGDYENSENLIISFYSASTMSSPQSVRPVVNDTEIYWHYISTYISPSKFNELTMVVNGATVSLMDKINQCQINGIDAYNAVTHNTSFNSTNVMCLKSGGTVLCELPNPWHITQPISDIESMRCNLFSIETSGVYAVAVRFLNVTSEYDTVGIYMYSLNNFTYNDNDTIRHANNHDGFYSATTLYAHNDLAPIISYAMPTLEYDCETHGIPNGYQPYSSSDIYDCLTNGTEQSVEIATGDSGMQTGQFLNGSRVFIDDTDTSSSIWTKITAVSPNRVIPDEFSTLIPSVGTIANESGLSVSLPTEMTETSVASVGTTANTDETDYTATGIASLGVGVGVAARAIGANITGVGVTEKAKGWAGAVGKAIDKAMSLDYTVADVEEPTELELTDMGITPTNTTPSGGANTMYSVYKLDETELSDFASWLWSSDILTQLSKAWSNPMGNIIALQKVYVNLPTGTNSTIKVGGVESNVSCKKLNSRYLTVDFGSVNVDEYFGNMLDYNPYTDIQIYLPFIGVQRLDNSDIMRSIISLKYTVDIFTGDLLAEITCYRDLVTITSYQFTGNCAVAYPYSSGSMLTRNLGVVSGAGMLIGAGLGIASAGALTAGALASGIGGLGAIATSKADISHSSDLSGSIGVMGGKKPYLIITRPQQISNELQNKFVANANNIVDKISNHSGLIKVTEPQIKISVMKSEIEMIRNELERGILV